jgi:hypothetical protein
MTPFKVRKVRKKLNKKGFQLTEVPTFAVILLVLAIVLGLGATVLDNMQGTSTMTSTGSRVDDNNTFTASNATSVAFYDTSLDRNGAGWDYIVTGSCTDVSIFNSTGANNTADFTVSGCNATLSDNTQDATSHTANYTYSFTEYNYNYNVTQTGLESQEDLSDWQPTFVVIIAAAVVLMILGKYLFFN